MTTSNNKENEFELLNKQKELQKNYDSEITQKERKEFEKTKAELEELKLEYQRKLEKLRLEEMEFEIKKKNSKSIRDVKTEYEFYLQQKSHLKKIWN